MRSILVVLALVAIAHAEYVNDDDIDWSTVKYKRIPVKLPFDLEDHVFDDRVVGGEVVTPHSIPYQAALVITGPSGTYLCGGVLVSPRHVLTAGHCIVGAAQIQVRLGAHYWNANEVNQQRITSTNYTVHAGWDPSTLVNDLGVVNLPVDAVLNDFVQVVPLPQYADVGNSFLNATATLSGWGTYSDAPDAAASLSLRAVVLQVISNLACNISFLGAIASSHVCTSGAGGVGGCRGDSGNPLVTNNRLIGVVSFALELGCETGWPTVYSRITHYLDWLRIHTDANIS